MSNEADKSLELIKQAFGSEPVAKAAITSGSVPASINLLPAARSVVTLVRPLADDTTRIGGGFGKNIQYNIYQSGSSVPAPGAAEEGKRGEQITFSPSAGGATYKTIMIETEVTDIAQEVAFGANGEGNQEDMFAYAIKRGLIEAMRREESWLIGGRTTTATDPYAPGGLGTTNTPTATGSASGGSIGAFAGGLSVIAVALSYQAYVASRGYAINTSLPSGAGIPLPGTRTNAGGTTTAVVGGAAIKSAAATTSALSGSSNSVTVKIPTTQGAAGYAIFAGASGSEVFQGVIAQSYCVLTSLSTGTQAAASNFTSDNSADPLQYDGLLTRLLASGSGAQVSLVPNNTTLTNNGRQGISQLDQLLLNMYSQWDGHQPDYFTMNANSLQSVQNALLSGSSQPNIMLVKDAASGSAVMAGQHIDAIKSPTGAIIPIKINPYLPDSLIMGLSKTMPTKVTPTIANGKEVNSTWFVQTVRDYWSESWPRVTTSRQQSTTIRSALAVQWAPGCIVLQNFN